MKDWCYRKFVAMIDPEMSEEFKPLFRLLVISVSAISLVFALSITLILGPSERMGIFGDFVGGILNPLLTFITFAGLLITIVLQRKELRESREEFKRSADALSSQNVNLQQQRFESTFFQMLTLHNNIVNSLVVRNSNSTYEGRAGLSFVCSQLKYSYQAVKDGRSKPKDGLDEINGFYEIVWGRWALNLAHYYRNLYTIVVFIKEQEKTDGPYIKILRSQLSDEELILLMYNCLTHRGRKFKPLVEEFSLLNNLPFDRLVDPSHKSLMNENAYGPRDDVPGSA